MGAPRYRCDGCGNLTRFDVTASQRTKAFHHYTVGGEMRVEEETVLSHHVDEVSCRWCGHGRSVVELGEDESGAGAADQNQPEQQEPGAAARVT